jgi:hypothetical protein
VINAGWVDSCDGVTPLVEFLAPNLSLQHHLCALWEDEVIEEAGGAGSTVEPEFFQCAELYPFAGRRGDGWFVHVVEVKLDEFK